MIEIVVALFFIDSFILSNVADLQPRITWTNNIPLTCHLINSHAVRHWSQSWRVRVSDGLGANALQLSQRLHARIGQCDDFSRNFIFMSHLEHEADQTLDLGDLLRRHITFPSHTIGKVQQRKRMMSCVLAQGCNAGRDKCRGLIQRVLNKEAESDLNKYHHRLSTANSSLSLARMV